MELVMDLGCPATEGSGGRLSDLVPRLVSLVNELTSTSDVQPDRVGLLEQLGRMGLDARAVQGACTDFAGWWEAVETLANLFIAGAKDPPPVVEENTGPANWRDAENALKLLGVDACLLLRAADITLA